MELGFSIYFILGVANGLWFVGENCDHYMKKDNYGEILLLVFLVNLLLFPITFPREIYKRYKNNKTK